MRLRLHEWKSTLTQLGFRTERTSPKKPAQRGRISAIEPLEERRMRTGGLSPVLSVDLTAAKTFWNEQLATGSPLLSGPVTDYAPSGSRPGAGTTPPNVEQMASPVTPTLTGAALLAATLSNVNVAGADTISLSGGDRQAAWSQPLGPQTREMAANAVDLRQLPQPSTLVFNGVDNVNDSLALDLSTLPRTPDGKSVVKTIVYNGGAGAFDTLRVSGGQFQSVAYTATGKDSGIVTYNSSGDASTPDLTIIFTGLEPYEDYTTASQIVINGLPSDDQIYAVDGTPHLGADTIKVYEANDNFENVTFANKGGLGIYGNGGNDTIDVSGVSATNTALAALATNGIVLWGWNGDDTLVGSGSTAFSQYLEGFGGNDSLYATAPVSSYVTFLVGDDGDDQLYSGPGNDIMEGGLGSDTYYFNTNGYLGSDEIFEGSLPATANDVDTIDVSANTDVNWVDLSYTSWQTVVPYKLGIELSDAAGIEDFIGGSGGGSISGNSRDNGLTAGPGTYGIDGYAGDDTITGDDGDDYLVGDTGDDTIDGGPGANGLYGDDGNDTLIGGDDGNYMEGGNGDDTLTGGAGVDSLYGEAGDDTLEGGAGDDGLVGGDGNDTYVFETWVSDDGTLGSDTITEAANLDTDTLDFSGFFADQPVTIDLGSTTLQTVTSGVLSLTLSSATGIENVSGGDGADNITGNSRDNYIDGYAGNDTLNGGDGNDTLVGNDGNDILSGGNGDDFIFADGGNDTLDGGSGVDTLDGGDGINTLSNGEDNHAPQLELAPNIANPTTTPNPVEGQDATVYADMTADMYFATPQSGTLTSTVTAIEQDVGDTLTFTLPNNTLGASITKTSPTTADVSWAYSAADVGSTKVFHVRVTDNGSPNLYSDQDYYADLSASYAGDWTPIAHNDAYETSESTTLSEPAINGLVHNDVDPVLGHPISVYHPELITAANAALTVYADGSFTLIPTTGFAGLITFSYQLIDSVGRLSNLAQVTITDYDKPQLDIYDGQYPKGQMVLDENEETIGAFTVANLNDTDGDGLIDNQDNYVRPGVGMKRTGVTSYDPQQPTKINVADPSGFTVGQPIAIYKDGSDYNAAL